MKKKTVSQRLDVLESQITSVIANQSQGISYQHEQQLKGFGVMMEHMKLDFDTYVEDMRGKVRRLAEDSAIKSVRHEIKDAVEILERGIRWLRTEQASIERKHRYLIKTSIEKLKPKARRSAAKK